MAGPLRVDHAVSSGTFSLDGETFDVDNNIWVVGDDNECIVIDAPHSVDDILAVVGDRVVMAIVCTHAHDDHVRAAPELRDKTGAPILLHPDDRALWELTHTDHSWDFDLTDGAEVQIAGVTLTVLHTPGHAPGAVCLYAPELGCVFTGDTLFKGGPGATGRSFSDSPGAAWQRCRTHYAANLMAVTPKASWGWVKALLHSVYDQPDADAVNAQFDRILDALDGKLPVVAEHLETARADILAFTAFPQEVWRQIRSNNPNAWSAPSWPSNTTNGPKAAATSDSTS